MQHSADVLGIPLHARLALKVMQSRGREAEAANTRRLGKACKSK